MRARIEADLPRLTARTIAAPGMLTRELQKIREIGMGMDREESHPGVSCVAAPVFGADRKVRAALSITGATGSVDPTKLGPAVRTAAFTLSRALPALVDTWLDCLICREFQRMGSTRRSITTEYKAEAVNFALDGGRTITEAARNIGCHE